MIKEEIDQVRIESIGEVKYWKITMLLTPPPSDSGKVPCYADLVETAEDILRKTKGLGMEWHAGYAEVMAWSENNDRGILTPCRVRATLNMVRDEMEDKADADM